MKNGNGRAAAVLAWSMGCGGAAAQSLPAPEFVALAPVIVTATRTAETADEALASVSVITREDIERQQAVSVDDVLRGLAGVSISNNGGLGKNTDIRLRGTESDQVLVLIDGIKVGSATLGQAAFQDIPVELIDRIEVVRGPRSSLYGSEAIGGVIQIFTRKGGGPTAPYASVGAGSHSTSSLLAGLSGGGDRSWYNLSVSNVDTQGINACNAPAGIGGCFAVEPDNDAYRNRAFSLRGGYRFGNGLEVDGFALRARGKNEFDGTFVNESETTQQVAGGRLKFSPLEIWQVTVTAGQNRDESDNFLDGVLMSRFDTRRDVFSLQNDLAVSASQVLTLGYDYQDDRIESDNAFTRTSRDNNGVFGQYLGRFGRHDLQASLRYDDNQQFGGKSTGSAGYAYQITPGLRATASYGTAYKAPTFNELFFPGFGNPNLQPEESSSVEAGLDGTANGVRWSLHAYETRVDDLIAFDAATFLPQNIDKARIRGLEGIVGGRVAAWSFSANATLMDPRNDGSGPNRDNLLPRRAEQSLRIDVDRGFGAFSVGATFFAEGRRYDDLANTRRLGGYGIVDLRAEYRPHKDWSLQVKVGNVFDKNYQTAAFFEQPGTNVFFTLRYRPAGS
ncbi:MAG: TonB-dependent vitamin B12 receptor [Pseudomonadota bacterium]